MAYIPPNIFGLYVGAAIDVVGVYDQDGNQVFPAARPTRAFINPSARLMEHPVETGATIIDYRIILPIEIEMYILIPPLDVVSTYNEITQLFQNGEILTIVTRSGVYTNQILQGTPVDESVDFYGSLVVQLRFKQVQLYQTISTNEISPANPPDTNTVDRGNVQLPPLTQDQINSAILGGWSL